MSCGCCNAQVSKSFSLLCIYLHETFLRLGGAAILQTESGDMAKKKKIKCCLASWQWRRDSKSQVNFLPLWTSSAPGDLLLGFPLATGVPSMCLILLSYMKILVYWLIGAGSLLTPGRYDTSWRWTRNQL